MNLIILTVTVYLQLLIMRVSTLPLSESIIAKAFPKIKDDPVRINGKNISHPVYLYTRHTGKFVKVTSKKIDALTTKNNKYAKLLLTTRNLKGGISIQGKHSKTFVCMNDKGRVILQKTFEEHDCMFYMRIRENGYYTIRLVSNEKWFLGFKKSGYTKHGHETKYHHKAAWLMVERSHN